MSRPRAGPTSEEIEVGVDLWVWAASVGLILSILALDLFVFHREAHEVSFREATRFSVFWIAVGLALGGVIFAWQGPEAGGEYIAGYLIEKSLAVDNIFVFALIFGYFAVHAKYQHRVLFWGVVGALVFRAAFIAGGAALLENFHWMIYVFGGFLVFTGIRMARHRDEEMHLSATRRCGCSSRWSPQRTVPRQAVRRSARPEGHGDAAPGKAVLVETTDIIFAVDSIRRFAVTSDPFLVSPNAFAILGLRALYSCSGMIERFVYLKVGLAAARIRRREDALATLRRVLICLALAIAAMIGRLGGGLAARDGARRRLPRGGGEVEPVETEAVG
jgi:tellurite resistance protein TerC